MQVLPSTAVMLGFRGGADDLADPATNIDLGARYLAGAWRLAGGDICTAGMKYRAGHGETEFSALSNLYCAKLKRNLIVSAMGPSGSRPIGRASLRSERRAPALFPPGGAGGTPVRAVHHPRGTGDAGVLRKPRMGLDPDHSGWGAAG